VYLIAKNLQAVMLKHFTNNKQLSTERSNPSWKALMTPKKTKRYPFKN
jgi:hypothetical protein